MERFPDCHPVFIDCNDTLAVPGKLTVSLSRTAAIRRMDIKAEAVLLELSNKAQAYLSAEAESLNVQCSHNARAELKINVGALDVYADSFSTVELFGKAATVLMSTEGNSKVSLVPAGR